MSHKEPKYNLIQSLGINFILLTVPAILATLCYYFMKNLSWFDSQAFFSIAWGIGILPALSLLSLQVFKNRDRLQVICICYLIFIYFLIPAYSQSKISANGNFYREFNYADVLAQSLEDYKLSNGAYPESLNDITVDTEMLEVFSKTGFHYSKIYNGYLLIITVPFTTQHLEYTSESLHWDFPKD